MALTKPGASGGGGGVSGITDVPGLTPVLNDLETRMQAEEAESGGTAGSDGADGASAYEVAVAQGFSGDEAAWLASLIGPAGADGNDGASGTDGAPGADGASAYAIAVANGFVGTEAEWLASLVGADGSDGAAGTDGSDGASAYEVAVANGFVGDESAWLASLVGADGADGGSGGSAYTDDFTEITQYNSTSELVVYSKTIGADELGAHEVEIYGAYKNNSGSTSSFFLYLYLGGTLVAYDAFAISSTTQIRPLFLKVVLREDTDSQLFLVEGKIYAQDAAMSNLFISDEMISNGMAIVESSENTSVSRDFEVRLTASEAHVETGFRIVRRKYN